MMAWTLWVVLVFIIVCIYTSYFEDYRAEWTLTAVNTLIFQALKVAVGIAESDLAVLALMVSNHRANQQAEQLKLSNTQFRTASSQNRLMNYFHHKDYFIDHFQKLAKNIISSNDNHIARFEPSECYEVLFPNAKFGGFSCEKLLHETIEVNNIIHESIHDIASHSKSIIEIPD